jgi:predicted tellurium resistance membrane protein TerC
MGPEFTLTDPSIWSGLLALIVMEVVLGIDNVVFISLIIAKMDEGRREFARKLGLSLALVMRIILLLGIGWVIGLKEPVVEFAGNSFSWRDIILILGGLFLLAKATQEIHNDVEEEGGPQISVPTYFTMVILQIIAIDMVFSVDSIITAVGMTPHVEIMITAVIISVIVMYLASVQISSFIERHPTTKILALSFLLLVGAALVADGFGVHIPRGYVYFAMGYAAFIEALNIRRSAAKRAAKNKA